MKIDGKVYGSRWDIVRVSNALFVFVGHQARGHNIVWNGGSCWCGDCQRVWYDDFASVAEDGKIRNMKGNI